MALSKELLDILVCPETKQPLRLAEDAFVEKLNERIKAGTLVNRAKRTVTESVTGALIRSDNEMCYLITEDIPVMLIDEAIPMGHLT